MSSRQERIDERAKQVRKDEGASHGRNPETLDPEMLEGEDAEIVRANKEISRGDSDHDEHALPLRPHDRLPPD